MALCRAKQEVDPESGQGDGTTDAANRQQAAVEEQRREYCHLIRDISEDLKIPPWVAGSAMLYSHAFFSKRSMLHNDSLAIAIASVYAAAKIVELSGSGVPGFPEDPFPDYDRGNSAVLIKSAMKWLHRRHASKQSNGKVYPHVQRDERKLRQVVLTAERALLTELGFYFPDFPLHGEVYRLCSDLCFPTELLQAAWNIANDSFMMTIGLHAACIDTAWAVLLATTQLFEAESRLKSESGQYLWESDGVSTASVEASISAGAEREKVPLILGVTAADSSLGAQQDVHTSVLTGNGLHYQNTSLSFD